MFNIIRTIIYEQQRGYCMKYYDQAFNLSAEAYNMIDSNSDNNDEEIYTKMKSLLILFKRL